MTVLELRDDGGLCAHDPGNPWGGPAPLPHDAGRWVVPGRVYWPHLEQEGNIPVLSSCEDPVINFSPFLPCLGVWVNTRPPLLSSNSAHLIGTKWHYRVPVHTRLLVQSGGLWSNVQTVIAGTPDCCLVVGRASWVEG